MYLSLAVAFVLPFEIKRYDDDIFIRMDHSLLR